MKKKKVCPECRNEESTWPKHDFACILATNDSMTKKPRLGKKQKTRYRFSEFRNGKWIHWNISEPEISTTGSFLATKIYIKAEVL